MSKYLFPTGEANPEWKGGKSVASNGYIIIRVGNDHHLADVRGYAYEHRIIAEQKIGRRLTKGELVHHLDHNKANNDPANLEVKTSAKHHFVEHRKPTSRLQMPDEDNPILFCACGCNESFRKYDLAGRPREYVTGHNAIRTTYYCPCGCGSETAREGRYLSGHRKNRFNRRKVDEPEIIKCACGCGKSFSKYDHYGRPRKYVSGHNPTSK